MKRELTAPCGIDCFNCEVFSANITPEMQARMAVALGLPEEKVPCAGCRESGGCRLHWGACDTLDCVKARGVDFCFQCQDFPCEKLQPAADGAARYPHNMKVYNLSRMLAVGVERWAEDEALAIRRRYFKGKFIVGRGPVLE